MDLLPLINRLVSQPNGLSRNKDDVKSKLIAFSERLSDPSAELGSEASPDDLRPLLTALGEGGCALTVDLELSVARTLKILLRKPVNRDSLGKFGVRCIVQALMRQAQRVTAATPEIGNTTLNACYNGANVMLFLEEGCMAPLLQLLKARDTAVQRSTLGALQSLCFVSWGRMALLTEGDAIAFIARYLLSDDELVRARAVGVLHNISAEVTSLALLRESMCIAPIISLLSDSSPEICQAAVGALQNISREEQSRLFMLEQGVVAKLTQILFGDNMQSQICCVGALLNLLGPALSELETAALCRVLSDGVVLGAVHSCVFSEDEGTER